MSGGLLDATAQPGFDDLAEGLAQMAQVLAIAQAQAHAAARGTDPIHWNEASLVWPLFTASLMKKTKG